MRSSISLPPLNFPENLPICLRRADISTAISASQVVIICGETGSGKTTQLPKICLDLGRGWAAGGKGLIGHTQPRRLAATATARRIAHELGSPLGEHVGFKVRFQDKTSATASIKLMTDGILLAETQSDPLLSAYDTLIIDEAHERSLNIDFLLGYLKQLLPRRPDLKLIVTSATIDAERFAKHFADPQNPLQAVPIIEVSGRLYPVEIRYRAIVQDAIKADASARESTKKEIEKERDLYDAIVSAVDELCRESRSQLGDILVFLPGEREIREAAHALRAHHPAHTEILPLFARLSAVEQEKIFRPANIGRRIVLATNVAETSLTVPGIRYVIDTGLARVKRYSYRNKVEQLRVESIAQASANQRAGRCGRVANGICIRLYDEADYLSRPRFTDPEIFRSSLASVILRMQALGLGAVDTFPFLDAPSGKAIQDGYQLLQELGALDGNTSARELTAIGKQLARLPLDPRIGRMLLAAREQHCLHEMLIITSGLSIQDVRDRPLEQQAAADNAHQKFADDKSEFLGFIKIWNWFEQAFKEKKSQRQLYERCRENFLSFVRLREWRDIHTQLVQIITELGWKISHAEATYEQLHLALLTGLLGNLGLKSEEEAHYLGARAIKFFLWPGSRLNKKAGKWIMAAELVETSRLFARTVARIEPQWIEKIAKHLIKKSIGEPHWSKKTAQVFAYERGVLYGLTIYQQRRVDYSKVDAIQAREMLIRRALVEGEFETHLAFFAHNQKLIREIENLEHTARRQDVLVDDELLYAFYDKYIPQQITSGLLLTQWYKEACHTHPRLLFLAREDLMRHEAAGITTDLFPKQLTMAGIEMGLTYHFEPGNARDGVTLTVPLYALNQIDQARCEWLVPGMLKEKIQQLLKSLPQKMRRHCVPLPSYAAAFCERATFAEGELLDTLMADLREQLSMNVTRKDFKLEMLAPYHSMNFKVVNEEGRQLQMGRNFSSLQASLGGEAQKIFKQTVLQQLRPLLVAKELEKETKQQQEKQKTNHQGMAINSSSAQPISSSNAKPVDNAVLSNVLHNDVITNWSFGRLPELLEIQRSDETLIGYPALLDKNTHCELAVFDEPAQAQRLHLLGLRRLFSLQLREQIKFLEKNIPNLQKMAMHYLPLGSQEELREQIVQTALVRAFVYAPLPEEAAAFAQRLEEGRSRLNLLAQELARHALLILTEYAAVAKKLQQIKSITAVYNDMQAQLSALIGKNFIATTPSMQLTHFPRYLQGMLLRIDKLRADGARDAARLAEFSLVQKEWQRAMHQRRNTDAIDTQLDEFRWLLEELRIALFAQELRTPMPVSVKRLQKIWQSYAC